MYSTPADVRAVLARTDTPSQWEDTPAIYQDEQILDSITRADARIDLYLGSRYTVPVVAPTAILRDYSSVLAAYYLTLTQSNNQDVEGNDPIRLRAAEIMAELKAILEGTILLPLPTDETEPGEVSVTNKYDGDLFLLEEFLSPTAYNLPVNCCGTCYDGTRCDCA
jgi:phage gp36-like protein